ncbi:MAG: RsmB/NOP family class I SAM-dependent RNA methyltransferase [Candidatus Aenigmarchaeota archaeon]|nr:RsmB/NOP family class I SAM-dependent RNA methyltransferase [Candidatus Aenigmarchaeota archaeon]
MIPKILEEKINFLYPEDVEKFKKIHEFKKSIRVNTLKISKKELVERLKYKFEIEEIPWCDQGLFIKGYEITNTIEYFLGYYYIQDSASMIPPLVLEPKENDLVLDIAASPGSKTTQIAALMNNKGLIIANDVNIKRLTALRFNLQKCGVVNTIVTNLDGRWINNLNIKFDKILVDAPCSASGTCITNPNVFNSWDQGKVNMLSRLQKQLLEAASKCLKEGGVIVYSTCSLDPEENEEVIDFAIKKLGLTTEKIKIKNIETREAIRSYKKFEYDDNVKNAIRINPFDNMTEGFFICKLRKY